MSPASTKYRSSNPENAPSLDPNTAGELPIDTSLTTAFLESLAAHKLTLRLFSGSWETFDLALSEGPYNLVMTSETIYRMESVPSLLAVLQASCGYGMTTRACHMPCLCLVAAKVLYFGVGGGVADFVRAVEDVKGNLETVWEHKMGVGRRIMRVVWGDE